MKSIATLLQGIALGAGMFLIVGLCIGAFQQVGYLAIMIGMAILAVLGFVLGRWVWPQRSHAWKITAAAFVSIVLIQVMLPFLLGGESPFSGGAMEFLKGLGVVMWFFVPWFWLPFAIGLLASGFRRKASHEDPSEHPTV